jgi:hypothetical protein
MIATTTTRKPTETIMPSRVKNERSLLDQMASNASRRASRRGMEGKKSGERGRGKGKGAAFRGSG